MAQFDMIHQEKQDPKDVFAGKEPSPEQRAGRHEDDSFGEDLSTRPSVRQSTRSNLADMMTDLDLSPNSARFNVIAISSLIAVVLVLFFIVTSLVT